VEFGTSFGVSTLWLAAAVRDNGCGRVIATHLVPEQAQAG
jgi:predicted O-methyltransferase YrrM